VGVGLDFVTDNGESTGKVGFAALAGGVLEKYEETELAGKRRSVKRAIDDLAQQVDDAVESIKTKADQTVLEQLEQDTAAGIGELAQNKADTTALEAETAARQAADTALNERIDAIPDPLGAYIVETAEGAAASFGDGADGVPLKSCVVHIEPVQTGSGDPSPENVRPITGWTGVTLSHSGADTNSPDTYSISFGEAGTVYGGTLDVVSGVLTVDRVKIQLNGSMDWKKHDKGAWVRIPAAIDAGNATAQKEILVACDTLQPTSWVGISALTLGVSMYYGHGIILKNAELSTLDAYKSWINQLQPNVVYKLAAPIIYHLTPQEIASLLGTNNIWADCGNVSVEYRVDPTLAYNELKNAILSTGGNV